MSNQVPAVILSGGSEIVALSVAEALAARNIPLIVIGMGKLSLIRDVPNVKTYRQMTWPPSSTEAALQELIRLLTEIHQGASERWPVFATEDGGLHLLLEFRRELSAFLIVPGTPLLEKGGLDKAEFFLFLEERGYGKYLAPTIVLNSYEEVSQALDVLGEDAVFKPALKPLSMDMLGMASKVITARPQEPRKAVMARLIKAWPISSRWLVQKRLHTPLAGEGVLWGLRTREGKVICMTAYDRWKQPKMGGSGCWVETAPILELQEAAQNILDSLAFRGIFEMEFLKDTEDRWLLLEFNPRPWLQVGLPEAAGLPIIWSTYLDLLDQQLRFPYPVPKQNIQWVNPERMIIAALSGEQGARLRCLSKALQVSWHAHYKTVYSTPFAGIRQRWLARMMEKAWQSGYRALKFLLLRDKQSV